MKNISLILVSILATWFCFAQTIERDLSTNNWQFREFGTTEWMKATVPGGVHTDLLSLSEIEDPYYRSNEDSLQWIGEKKWEYFTRFDVAQDVLSKEVVELLFKGLDTYCEVYLNEEKIMITDNFFREYTIDCKQWLKPSGNELRLVFTPAKTIIEERKKESEFPFFDDLVYIRKPAYHFGWDWGPVYHTMGIWQPIVLKAWNKAKINNVQLIQKELGKKSAVVTAKLELRSGFHQFVTVEGTCKETGQTVSKTVKIQHGNNYVELDFNIQNPELWWCNGLGKQPLYHFTTSVKVENEVTSTHSDYIGLRTVRLIQEKDSLGSSFAIELNGHRIFMKGANYIPQDMFLSRPTEADYEGVIQQALDANMNMLRLWGGGFFEKDIFYELCDKNGLLVWHDLMFACSMYPGTEAFINNVKQETTDNIKRLRNHPCIALWCGNNENYIGWRDWRWPKKFAKEDSAEVWFEYEKLFHIALPDLIQQLDAGRFYWPSSPTYGWGYPVNADGDVHYWGIWHAREPFENFKKPQFIGRFMSEYGFQSLPELSTINKFTLPEDRDINSPVMKKHQKHYIGYPIIDQYMDWYYRKPKDFESYVYVSQLVQAYGIGMAISTHHSNKPHCMGTLYWQLNDCWPVASWASTDYYDNWKALHYRVKELYQNLSVVTIVDSMQVKSLVVNDFLTKQKINATLEILSFDGKKLFSISKKMSLAPNGVQTVFQLDRATLPTSIDPKKCVVVTRLTQAGETVSSHYEYFSLPKDLLLEKPEINYRTEKSEKGFILYLSTNTLVKNLQISSDKAGFFSDNYVDVIPGEEKKIEFITGETALGQLSFFSLIDSF